MQQEQQQEGGVTRGDCLKTEHGLKCLWCCCSVEPIGLCVALSWHPCCQKDPPCLQCGELVLMKAGQLRALGRQT